MTDESITLAFALETLEALEDPESVFKDADRWSTYVGVISDQMAYQVVNYLRENGVFDEDFFSRADKAKSLEYIAKQTSTDRHVLVGDSDADERLATDTGWEYISLEEAADKAGWNLTNDGIRQ